MPQHGVRSHSMRPACGRCRLPPTWLQSHSCSMIVKFKQQKFLGVRLE